MERRHIRINMPPESAPDPGYDRLRAENARLEARMRRLRRGLWIGGGSLGLLLGAVLLWAWLRPQPVPLTPEPVPTAETHRYGVDLSPYELDVDLARGTQTLFEVFMSYQVPAAQIGAALDQGAPYMATDTLVEGARLTFAKAPDNGRLDWFIYEPDPFAFIQFELGDTVRVRRIERARSTRTGTAAGIIDSTLFLTFYERGYHYELIGQMEEVLKWAVDFFHLDRGDRFKLIYDGIYADEELVGVARIRAVYFRHRREEVFAYYFDNGRVAGFFDEKARPMQRSFLKSPVKYARISSPFNLNRFHPVLKKVKPHLGTDYAAPEGTPVLAVADGEVTAATFTANNGNYVKIRHDGTYQTQYLHFSAFGEGIQPGVRVRQGQVIGYVGQTGLASGPHVCFRFWKNDQQVDPREETLPYAAPLPQRESKDFFLLRDSLQGQLNQIDYF